MSSVWKSTSTTWHIPTASPSSAALPSQTGNLSRFESLTAQWAPHMWTAPGRVLMPPHLAARRGPAMCVLPNGVRFGMIGLGGEGALADTHVAALTMRGKSIHRGNEDAVGVIELPGNPSITIDVIADGVGGGPYGERASAEAIQFLLGWFADMPRAQLPETHAETVTMVRAPLDVAMESMAHRDLCGLSGSCTIVIAISQGRHVTLLALGDSPGSVLAPGDTTSSVLVASTYPDTLAVALQHASRDEAAWLATVFMDESYESRAMLGEFMEISKRRLQIVSCVLDHGGLLLLSSDGVMGDNAGNGDIYPAVHMYGTALLHGVVRAMLPIYYSIRMHTTIPLTTAEGRHILDRIAKPDDMTLLARLIP